MSESDLVARTRQLLPEALELARFCGMNGIPTAAQKRVLAEAVSALPALLADNEDKRQESATYKAMAFKAEQEAQRHFDRAAAAEADNERLTAQNKRLQDERDARLWHHPMWSSTPGGSITDGQCVMCRQMWPCAFVRNTADQAYAERDIAIARADAAEARLTQITEWTDRLRSMWEESPETRKAITARYGPLAWCLESVIAAASVVSGDTPNKTEVAANE